MAGEAGEGPYISPKSGCQVWACWVWARRAQTQLAQSLGRLAVTIPRAGLGDARRQLSVHLHSEVSHTLFLCANFPLVVCCD